MATSDPKSELRRRLNVALLLPVGVLAILAAIMAVQVEHQTEDAAWVDHTDEVLGKSSDLLGEIIDQETGVRGFLLTADELFLEPFRKAHPIELLGELRVAVSDDPAQVARVDEIRRRYEYWKTNSARVTVDLEQARTPEAMREGKREMDDIRAAVRGFRTAEFDHRRNRTEAAAASRHFALLAGVVLAVFAAAALAFASRRQLAQVASAYDDLIARESVARAETENDRWVRTGEAALAGGILGQQSLDLLSRRALTILAEHMNADLGVFFVVGLDGLERKATYGLDPAVVPRTLALDEGLAGRAVASKSLLHLRDVPPDFLRIRSGAAEGAPREVVAVPAMVNERVEAVLEFGFLRAIDRRSLDLLAAVGRLVGAALESERYRQRLTELLDESQQQSEELQSQQEELRVANEDLVQQGVALRDAHQRLEERQESIEKTNALLEEKASELAQSREAFRSKALEADRASRYKSEFLANMSHELRTPLNSTLILAKLLADNREGTLNAEQVRFAKTIQSSGHDLLRLINDVLDLAKVEAGRIEARATEVSLQQLSDSLKRTFDPLAGEKRLSFSVTIAPEAPACLVTDGARTQQVLTNLLSNACKFTESGSIALRIRSDASSVLFEVTDTGIGIPVAEQASIFEPFRQVDGSLNRRQGGTGLGLSISRELAALLGGTLDVESEHGKGSLFRLRLPIATPPRLLAEPRIVADGAAAAAKPSAIRPSSEPPPAAFEDDRLRLEPGAGPVLVIEDDVAFARILYDLAHERNLRCIVAHDAKAGLKMAAKYTPGSVILDMNLPDRTGLYVLDQLKRSPATRHIPVHVVSVEERAEQALSMGAVGYLRKPTDRQALAEAFARLESRAPHHKKRLLLVEHDEAQRKSLEDLLQSEDVEILGAATAKEALSNLAASTFDCVVTDLDLPDESGFDLLADMAGDDAYSFPPVIVYTGRKLTIDEEQRLRQYSSSVILKGARSPERLVQEVSLFLHQVESLLPPAKRRLLGEARDREDVLEGKIVLVVEDDVRNVFALTKVLEPHGARVLIARNGREALEALDKSLAVDLVLMDVMMPEMDGLEATRRIRSRSDFRKLPIIALTAKAMPDDRTACLDAGASDYITKPLDVDTLLSLIRVWMPR